MRYRFLDGLWHAAHLVLMAFSAFGWISPTTRPWHLAIQALVGLSWFILGSRRGWGYCWLTDHQWAFKEAHGRRPATDSFVEHWTNDLLGLRLSSALVQGSILWIWIATTVASFALWASQG